MIIRDISHWTGCLPRKRLGVPASVTGPNRSRLCNDLGDTPLRNWINQCVPTYNQKGESCVGEGWANFLEIILRFYAGRFAIPLGMQLDGYAVWVKAKQMFYNGVLKGGLQIPEGFEAMKALGWIPEETMLVDVAVDWNSQVRALLDTPLVVGHMVTQGWFNPNPENGCLDHDPVDLKHEGGHCTCRVGPHIQNRVRFFSGLNSWGEDYANHGIFLMSEVMDSDTTLDAPYTISIPGGFARLKEHIGWQAGLINTPKGNL